MPPLRPLPPKPAAKPILVRRQTAFVDHVAYGALVIFLFLLYGRIGDIFFGGLHLPLITSSLALVMAVLSGGVLGVIRHKIGILLILLTGWFVATIPFAIYRGGSFETVTQMWFRSFLSFALIVAVTRKPSQIQQILRMLAWSLLVTAILALAYGELMHGRLRMPAGLLAGSNELGGAMIIGILYCLFIVLDDARALLYRGFALAATLPMTLALLKTGSRGSMLTLAVVLTILFFGLSLGRKVVVAACALIVIMLGFLALPEELRLRYTTVFNPSVTEEGLDSDFDSATGSTESRLYLLQRSIQFTMTHPVFGIGPDNFPVYEDQVQKAEGKPKGSWLGTHNTYTQVSSEAGIPGLILFLSILVLAWRSTRRTQAAALRLGGEYGRSIANTAMALRTLLIAYLVFFCFEHTAYLPFWPTLMGMIAALETRFFEELPAKG